MPFALSARRLSHFDIKSDFKIGFLLSLVLGAILDAFTHAFMRSCEIANRNESRNFFLTFSDYFSTQRGKCSMHFYARSQNVLKMKHSEFL